MTTNPNEFAKNFFDKGMGFLKNENYTEAEKCFAEAISLDENNPNHWAEMGLVWAKTGRITESVDAFQVALNLSPTHFTALYNMGLSLSRLGKLTEAVAYLEKAYQQKPDPDLAEKLGNIFYVEKDHQKAAIYYNKAREGGDKTDARLSKLAVCLYQNGDISAALSVYIELVLKHPDNEDYVASLVDMYKNLSHTVYTDSARQIIMLLLKKENIKHRYYSTSWSTLVLLDPRLEGLRQLAENPETGPSLESIKDCFKDELLCLGLEKVNAVQVSLEKFLTSLRKYFLLHWQEAAKWPAQVLDFLAALAVQNWYNDYIFYETAEEIAALEALKAKLTEVLPQRNLGNDIAALFALYGCYRPLYDVMPAELGKPAFAKGTIYKLRTLIKAQIKNPRYEHDLIPTIPSFTPITDQVSQAVRAMYEQRPYPRWRSALKNEHPTGISSKFSGLKILVAGCGTGQEPTIYANTVRGAKITAIDLSFPSIAYAKRMAEELDFIGSIDFKQGDLMEVSKLGEEFDYICSSGVLHHLKDPAKGLAAIVSVLKPHGRMSISLYSEIARNKLLNPASDYIRDKGYTSSDADIRQFRRDIMALPESDPRKACSRIGDFYCLSECNDLLFHVQEHRFTFLSIKAFIETAGLELHDVSLDPVAKKQYFEKFPQDGAKYTFEHLHEFESEHPDLFLGMYKVYLRRKGDTTPHPLDSFIELGRV
jgi:2-polyprenyl-3-methyl-5-hydroxy-6-metoxy-1,4-benzoquinol methylase/Tfp pilus assembly protein PilF